VTMRGCLLLLGMVAMGGCAAKAPVDEDFSDLAGLDVKSDVFSYRMKLVGTLPGNQTLSVPYTSRPRFRGVTVPGVEGREVDIWVQSTDGGDAVTWLTDDKFRIIAKNDDANQTTYDSHIHATLPASTTNTYYIVFRDYSLAKHTFTVSYRQLHPQTPGPTAPSSGSSPIVQTFVPLLRAAGVAFASDSHVVAEATLPGPVRSGYAEFVGAASAGVEVVAWRFRSGGANAFAVMMQQDGSFWVSLFDAAGRWVAHGRAGDFAHDQTLAWDLDIDDPTICRCGLAPDGSGYAGCEWVDGNRYTSDISDCD